MIVARHLVAMWRAAIANEPFEWSESTPTQPRTEAGIILLGCGVLFIGSIYSEFAITSPLAMVAATLPAIVAVVGGILILVSLVS